MSSLDPNEDSASAPLAQLEAVQPDARVAPLGKNSPFVGVKRGTAEYRRINIALFAAGFCTFSLIYSVQAILPLFATLFHVGGAQSSLALSMTTGFIAWSILIISAGSQNLGRKKLMFASMFSAAIINLLTAFAPNWTCLLILRGLEGIALGGIPAVAMAYLAEETDTASLGYAMGLYIGGNAIGGMVGRISTGYLAELFSWRVAMFSVGALGVVLALVFNRLLPASKNFHRQTDFHLAYHLDAFVTHLKNKKLDLLFLIGFLMMGTFVTIYNYLGFRLTAAPYHLSATQISFIFLAYIFGATSSPFAGSLADRIGRFPVILLGIGLTLGGVLLTLAQPLWIIVLGVILVTIGFFMTHSIASSWVGKLAKESKGHASSLYLLAYYLGSSILGSLGGWYWDRGQWLSVIDYTSILLIGSLITALVVGRLSGVKVKAW